MNWRALAFAFALHAAALPASRPAYAQAAAAPSDALHVEARERFDRGLRLFNAGDNAGALAEFKRAYELVGNVVALYNIGLVHAEMEHAVEATDALDRVLANPGTLSPERVANARRTREEQAARIANIAVWASVEGSVVEVDGIEAGKAPLAQPLRVTSGTHVIGAVAPGFAPQRKQVTIAGGETQSVRLELVPIQGRLAHLAVATHLPGAQVFADDQRIGTTLLSASISLAPGSHRIELRRPGYSTARTQVQLDDGATGEVTLEPEEDHAVSVPRGLLAIDASETQAVVSVDGRRQGLYRDPLRLPAGPHRLRVERADFEPFERDVTVGADRTTAVAVPLEPTPEYRARYASHARSTRTWAIVSIVAGTLVAAGGVGLVLYDRAQRDEWTPRATQLEAALAPGSLSSCDPRNVDIGTPDYAQRCQYPLDAANARVSDANTRDYFAWGGVGLGAAGAVLGVVLLITADDPHKYDRPSSASRDAFPVRVVPTLSPGHGGGIALTGTF
jgi:PEGA domain